MRLAHGEKKRGKVGSTQLACRMYRYLLILSAALLVLGWWGAMTCPVSACETDDGESRDAEPYYFYQRLPYGSDALVHPLRLIINGGFGITQLDNRDNCIGNINYRNGWDNLMLNLGHPVAAIEREGWGNFFFRQVAPFSTNRASAQYWPNYTQHLIGGGMSYRLMIEWFRHHDYRHPTLWACATITAYHLLNEVVENNDYVGYSTDPIADLYIFDPLSMLLFSSDRVSRFFGQTLLMADWSYQACLDPASGRIENNGQNYALKFPLPGTERWRFFYHYGTHGEGGLSYTRASGDCFSFATGFKAKELVDLTQGNRTVDLALVAGVFYDRHNSLLASLIYAETKDCRLRLNLYPGLLGLGPVSPGFFLALGSDERILIGVTLDFLPHLPCGLATSLN